MPPDITSIDSDISKWFSHKFNFFIIVFRQNKRFDSIQRPIYA